MNPSMRRPLWKRASDTRSTSDTWWTDAWLEDYAGEHGRYPILCRVRSTHAEFPPDRFKKTERNGKVYWNKAKPLKQATGSSKYVRLVSELQPLSTVVPPSESGVDIAALPPPFHAVSFPSEKAEPFLVPFLWAYTKWALVKQGNVVNVAALGASRYRISGANKLEHDPRAFRVDDVDAGSLLISSRSVSEKIFSSAEIYAALDVVSDTFALPSSVDTDFVDQDELRRVFRLSFPLWKGVSLTKVGTQRQKDVCSIWDVAFEALDESDALVNRLDQRTVDKIVSLVEDIMDKEDFSDFVDEVDEETAPSYGSAVPVQVCLSSIVDRLRSDDTCFYRSAIALLEDVMCLLKNSLLYNDPESEIVVSASEMVAKLRGSIADIHASEESLTASSPKLVSTTVDSSTEGLDSLRHPYRGKVDREWYEGLKPSSELPEGYLNSTAGAAVFQTGDRVVYSSRLHDVFIAGHMDSLQSEQCLSMDPENSGASPTTGTIDKLIRSKNTWRRGRIVACRPCFPRSTGAKKGTDSYPLVLELRIRFDGSDDVDTVFWRPCEDSLAADGSGKRCSCCRLPTTESFLALERTSLSQSFDPASVSRAFSLVKRKILKREQASAVDNRATVEGVSGGFVIPPPKIAQKSLPSYEQCLPGGSTREVDTDHAFGTRRKKAGESDSFDDASAAVLIENGFLSRGFLKGRSETDVVRVIDSVSPSPLLSLETLLLRIDASYYRQRIAIENDIIESFISLAAAFLSAQSKKTKQRTLSERMATELLNAVTSEDAALSLEGSDVLDHLLAVCDTHATLLLAVSKCDVFDLINGLTGQPELADTVATPSDEEPSETEQQVDARLRVQLLLSALGEDEQLGVPRLKLDVTKQPDVRFKVTAGGKVVTRERFMSKTDSLEATVNGDSVQVSVLCNGHPVKYEKHLKPSRRAYAAIGSSTIAVRILYKGHEVVSDPSDRPGVKRILEKGVTFDAQDYSRSDNVARFLIGRPGRMSPCSRCMIARTSLFECRVTKMHSNIDFDIVSFFQECESLDRLLDNLAAGSASETRTEGGNHNSASSTRPSTSEKASASAMVDTAEQALVLATKAVTSAKKYADAPLRLSKEFIDRMFPFDKSDGHFSYCVVCGLSGDLLCCDGCPNVVHASCIKVGELPDGDWFCEECRMGDDLLSTVERTPNGGSPSGVILPSEPATLSKEPFQRNSFYDDKLLEDIDQLLDVLREARPEKDRVRKKQDDQDNEQSPELKSKSREPKVIYKDDLEEYQDGDSSDGDAEGDEDGYGGDSDTFHFLPDVAQAFMSDNKIRSIKSFLEMRGVELAPRLARWRRREGLPELRGSGHSATISAWKTMCRNEAAARGDTDTANIGFRQDASPAKKKQRSSSVKKSKAKKKPLSDNPLDVLSDTTLSFLESIGITTAQQLLDARTSDVASMFGEWRKEQGMAKLQGSGEVASVSGWKGKLREALGDVDKDDTVNVEPPKDDGPFAALSDRARSFLESIDVTTVEQLLEARSVDLAEDFRQWRRSEGLPKLKGSGEVATISAWKTTVRKGLGSTEQPKSTPKKGTPKKRQAREEPEPERRSTRERSKVQYVEDESPTRRKRSRKPTEKAVPTALELLSEDMGHSPPLKKRKVVADKDLEVETVERPAGRRRRPPDRFGSL